MILTLLSHQWKSFWRGRGVTKSLAMQLFLGFVILYLLLTCLFLGFSLGHFLHTWYPKQDPIHIYCGLILYYFATDVIMRFIFQELPVISIQPYLIQNIHRRQLVNYLNARSLFHFLNLLPLFIFLPFIFTNIAPAYGAAAATTFTLSIVLLTCFNHFGMLYVIRKAYLNSWWLLGFVVAVAIFAALDYFHLLSASAFSSFLFMNMLRKPWLVLVPLLLAAFAFLNNRHFLLDNLYMEELSKKDGKKQSAEYTWLQQWGIMGELIGLDIKLILRNKRPRTVASVSLIFLVYGLIFYRPIYLVPFKFAMLLFPAIFMTGLFIINYGQFAFAWQSNSFDGLLTSNLPVTEYIKGKLFLFTMASTIAFAVTSLYGFIDWRILPIQAAAWLYNIGLNSILTLWFATYSYKGLDLSKSAPFNYQGIGATTWLYALSAMLIPYAIFLPFFFSGYPWAGITALGITGVISLLLRGWWIELLTKQFYKRKHLILQGFREK